MKTLIFITILLFTFGCNPKEKKKHSQARSHQKTEKLSHSTKIFPSKNYPLYRFQDYSVKQEPFKVAKALDAKSFEKYSNFKTRIHYGFKQAPNFANHYIVVSWGCGSSCQSGVIINAKSGKIIGLPTSSFGLEYRRDSKLLIVNPFLEEEKKWGRDKVYSAPSYYVFEINTLKQLP